MTYMCHFYHRVTGNYLEREKYYFRPGILRENITMWSTHRLGWGMVQRMPCATRPNISLNDRASRSERLGYNSTQFLNSAVLIILLDRRFRVQSASGPTSYWFLSATMIFSAGSWRPGTFIKSRSNVNPQFCNLSLTCGQNMKKHYNTLFVAFLGIYNLIKIQVGITAHRYSSNYLKNRVT